MKVIIHGVKDRRWYIENFLIPQLQQQNIEEIKVWLDNDKVGNLLSCMQCFENLPDDNENTWHLQDDIVLCKDFKKRAEKFESYNGLVNGISVLDCEKEYEKGETDIQNMWYSFPCIMIPNNIAKGCSSWFNEKSNTKEYQTWLVTQRGDDAVFKDYIADVHPDIKVFNVVPNLVDHIDYLLGGSTGWVRRHPIRSLYWEDEEIVEDLERRIKGFG